MSAADGWTPCTKNCRTFSQVNKSVECVKNSFLGIVFRFVQFSEMACMYVPSVKEVQSAGNPDYKLQFSASAADTHTHTCLAGKQIGDPANRQLGGPKTLIWAHHHEKSPLLQHGCRRDAPSLIGRNRLEDRGEGGGGRSHFLLPASSTTSSSSARSPKTPPGMSEAAKATGGELGSGWWGRKEAKGIL